MKVDVCSYRSLNAIMTQYKNRPFAMNINYQLDALIIIYS